MTVLSPSCPSGSGRRLISQSTDGNEIPGASTEVNLQVKASNIKWDEWHTHRIDWVKGKSSWFVDDLHYLDTGYSVPTVPSYFVMVCLPKSHTRPMVWLMGMQNMWSDGGMWSGDMPKGQTAYMEIEFVEMAYNTSSGNGGGRVKRGSSSTTCVGLCSVDGVKVVGTPEPAGRRGAETAAAAAGAGSIGIIHLTFVLAAVIAASFRL
jgi:hypothetical protein